MDAERPLDASDQARSFVGAELLAARKAKDALAVSVLRSLAAAIDNAGAVPVPEGAQRTDPRASSHHVAAGGHMGATEAPRRRLGAADLEALFALEVARRRETAKTCFALARPVEAQRALDELSLLEPLVARIQAFLTR